MCDTILQEIWKCVSQQTREDIARLIVHCSKKHTAAECLENNLKVSEKGVTVFMNKFIWSLLKKRDSLAVEHFLLIHPCYDH